MASKKDKNTPEYYTLGPIEKIGAVYNVIFGTRSYGKTYALLEKFIIAYWSARAKHELVQAAYIRRYDDAIRPKFAGTVTDTLIKNGNDENRIAQITNGVYDNCIYKNGGWYLAKYDKEKDLMNTDKDPFMLAFALNTWDKMKGGSYPYVTDIWFEEFIEVSTKPYLKNEWAIFLNVVSTIARRRDVRVWLTGNTINIYCPYFKNMGLKSVKNMKAGQIDVYSIGKTDRKIAVEMTYDTATYKESKRNNSYLYAFEDPRLQMLTKSTWEIGAYPLVQEEIKQADICGRFFIEFDDELFACELVSNDDSYIYIHTHNDPLRPPEDCELYYTPEFSTKPNYRRRIDRPVTQAERAIYDLFRLDKIVFDSNSTGNAVDNYLKTAMVGGRSLSV